MPGMTSRRSRLKQAAALLAWVRSAVGAPSTEFVNWTKQSDQALNDSWLLAVAAALPQITHWQRTAASAPLDYLLNVPGEGVRSVVRAALACTAEAIDTEGLLSVDLHEHLVACLDRSNRKRRGVYYTPPELARYMVSELQTALLGFFPSEGLLRLGDAFHGVHPLRILDPAAGSGIFLATIIRFLKDLFDGEDCVAWQQFVERRVIPHLVGWEIMPSAVVAAHVVVAQALHECDDAFGLEPLRIELRNALAEPRDDDWFPIVIGNPPYACLNPGGDSWIESILSGPGGYTTIDGAPLGERKHWLHDQYVKFFRLAQHHVEQCGAGVVAYVTNHGYLENTSFRGMRHSLLRSFPSVRVVDLRGSAKHGGAERGMARDENVFGISSGVAITVLTRAAVSTQPKVERAELSGSRQKKLDWLANSATLRFELVEPVGPHFRITPGAQPVISARYQAAWRLPDAMPVNTTAPVTARDGFVVAQTLEELESRLERFCDLSIPDEQIRARYFSRKRSSRYTPGDSRGWKLTAVRRAISSVNWHKHVRLCQYRPCDYRYLVWHPALVDWPRTEITRHLLEIENIALIARRQSPRLQPANYFWATRTLAVDGIVRSDNCGSESLFPVWIARSDGTVVGNFAPSFIAALEQATGWKYMDRHDAVNAALPTDHFSPLSLAAYIYGLFWSNDYRQDNQADLTVDFPRVVLPRDAADFRNVADRGMCLLRLHTTVVIPSRATANQTMQIAPGFPKWRDGRVWLNASTPIADVSADVWQMRIGSHQVAKKFLKARADEGLDATSMAAFRNLIEVLSLTRSILG